MKNSPKLWRSDWIYFLDTRVSLRQADLKNWAQYLEGHCCSVDRYFVRSCEFVMRMILKDGWFSAFIPLCSGTAREAHHTPRYSTIYIYMYKTGHIHWCNWVTVPSPVTRFAKWATKLCKKSNHAQQKRAKSRSDRASALVTRQIWRVHRSSSSSSSRTRPRPCRRFS